MKKQPRAIAARAWTARWMVLAYFITLIHAGQVPFTLATEGVPGVPGVTSSPEDTPGDNASQDSSDTAPGTDSSETGSKDEESSSEDDTASQDGASSESGSTNKDESSTESGSSSQGSSSESGSSSQGSSSESGSSSQGSSSESGSSSQGSSSESGSSSQGSSSSQEDASTQDGASSQDESETQSETESEDEDDDQDEGDEDEQDAENPEAIAVADGTLSITLPGDATNTYTVIIEELHYDNSGALKENATGTYDKTMTIGSQSKNVEFVIQQEIIYPDNADWYYNYLGHMATIKEVKANETLVINGISLPDGFKRVEYKIAVLQDSTLKPVYFDGSLATVYTATFDSTLTGIALEGKLATDVVTESDRYTTSTFDNMEETGQYLQVNGEYSTHYFLNYYSALSFGNIQATHIIGALVAQGTVTKGGNGDTLGHVSIADFSQGYPSYVGNVIASDTSSTSPSFTMNYDYDDNAIKTTEKIPYFYTDAAKYDIALYGGKDYIIGSDFIGIKAPNWEGEPTKTLLATDYFDFARMKTEVQQVSDSLANGTTVTGAAHDGGMQYIDLSSDTGYNASTYTLTVAHGGNYTITNPNNAILTTVVIDFGKDYTYGITPDDTPTTLNFATGVLSTGVKNGTTYEIFPEPMFLDATTGDTAIKVPTVKGEGGEYNDIGNKVIWNFPSSTDIVFYGSGINVLGHIIAPNATIHNYDVGLNNGVFDVNTNSWSGGNINGTIIAKNISIGAMEMHYWPYLTDAQKEEFYTTSITIAGEKKINGYDSSSDSFSFILTDELTTIPNYKDYSLTSFSNPSNYTFHGDKRVSTSGEGSFEFGKISFDNLEDNKTYQYIFYVYEDTTSTLANVRYDSTVYEVEVNVEVANNVTTINTSATAYKNGGASSASSYSQLGGNLGIIFTNEYETFDLPETGGEGTIVYTMLGLGLMCLAVVLLQPSRKETLL